MYWGLVLKTNKRYSQQITKGFHVSNATLDLNSIEKDATLSVWVHTDDSDHLLCNLSKQIPQVPLDLMFSEGETVAFYSKGNGTIHLNGNIIQEDDFGMGEMGDDEELDEEAEEEEIDYAALKKALKKEKAKAGKKSSEAEKEDSEDDSDDDDVDEDMEDEEDSDDDDDLDDDEDDLSDDDDEDEEEEEVSAPPQKKSKVETKQNGVATNGTLAQKQNDQGKKQKGAQQEQSKNDKKEQKSGKKTLASGVVIEDLSPGKGPEATRGKRVTVYYVGRLQKTNKVFDSTQSGEGFKFHLGKSEVIPGWDIGVVGMRVGGKRRIVCPPNAAYGAKGAPPAIPGNSTLVFEVTLRAIN